MRARYLFGPVSPSYAERFLRRQRAAGDCIAFDVREDAGNDLTIKPGDSWDDVCARLPEGWRPDFIALFLHYSALPACLENPPVPVVGLAGDANLLWHYYRRRLPGYDQRGSVGQGRRAAGAGGEFVWVRVAVSGDGGSENGDRHHLPGWPRGCCAQMEPVPVFAA
jgi:hypothetical protein